MASLRKKKVRSTTGNNGFRVTNTIFNSDDVTSSPSRSRPDSSPARNSLDDNLERARKIRRKMDSFLGDSMKRDQDSVTQVFHVSIQGSASGTKKRALVNSSPTSHSNIREPSSPLQSPSKEVSPSPLRRQLQKSLSYVRESLEKLDASKTELNELQRPPRFLVLIDGIRHSNDNKVIHGDNLTLNVSENDKFIFFKNGPEIIKDLVVNRLLKLKGLDFGDNLLLVKPINRADGAILVNFGMDETNILAYFRRNKLWRTNSIKQANSRIKSVYNTYVDEGNRNNILRSPVFSPIRDPKFNTNSAKSQNDIHQSSSDHQKPEDHQNNKTTPEKGKNSIVGTQLSSRITRSGRTADLTSPVKVKTRKSLRELTPCVDETPAPFEPPLRYTFHDKHTFHISKNDFKTLYNNDWINDTIIDFFMNYEVEKAVEQGKVRPHEIYAFNSFFFQKLTLGKTLQKDPPYYENVKRWLMKVDLGRYTYAIIPINEHLHWYGCIIKGILQFVWNAKFKVDDPDEQSEGQDEAGVSSLDAESLSQSFPVGSKIEVFVFDSLGHSHPSISKALKGFIIGYCEDKYSITISKDDIRLLNVKVPRQNNFNDCGVHVIYNIKKWLDNTAECEKIWRKVRSAKTRREADKFFQSSERNNMRRELIELLLQLHRESNIDEHKEKGSFLVSSKLALENHEDDSDVEFIAEVSGEASPGRNGKQLVSADANLDLSQESGKDDKNSVFSDESIHVNNSKPSVQLDPSIFLVENSDSVTFVNPDYKSKVLMDSVGQIAVPLSFERFMNTVFNKRYKLITKKMFLHCIKLYENAARERDMYNAVAETLESLEIVGELLARKEALSESVAARPFSITHAR